MSEYDKVIAAIAERAQQINELTPSDIIWCHRVVDRWPLTGVTEIICRGVIAAAERSLQYGRLVSLLYRAGDGLVMAHTLRRRKSWTLKRRSLVLNLARAREGIEELHQKAELIRDQVRWTDSH